MRERASELRLTERARRAELADVRRRLEVLTDRRLLASWTDDEAVEYAVLTMREHELLAKRPRPGLRRAAGWRGFRAWSPARRDA